MSRLRVRAGRDLELHLVARVRVRDDDTRGLRGHDCTTTCCRPAAIFCTAAAEAHAAVVVARLRLRRRRCCRRRRRARRGPAGACRRDVEPNRCALLHLAAGRRTLRDDRAARLRRRDTDDVHVQPAPLQIVLRVLLRVAGDVRDDDRRGALRDREDDGRSPSSRACRAAATAARRCPGAAPCAGVCRSAAAEPARLQLLHRVGGGEPDQLRHLTPGTPFDTTSVTTVPWRTLLVRPSAPARRRFPSASSRRAHDLDAELRLLQLELGRLELDADDLRAPCDFAVTTTAAGGPE